MNYIIGIILILCGLFTIICFPQRKTIDYVTKQEVKFEQDGAKLLLNMPENKMIKRVEILYHDIEVE